MKRVEITILGCMLGIALAVSSVRAGSPEEPVSVTLLENSSERIVIRYRFGERTEHPVLIDGRHFVELRLGSESRKKEVGVPALPDVSRSLIVPGGALAKARVLESTFGEVAKIDVAPSRGYIPRSVKPGEVPYSFGPAYSTDAYFPDLSRSCKGRTCFAITVAWC